MNTTAHGHEALPFKSLDSVSNHFGKAYLFLLCDCFYFVYRTFWNVKCPVHRVLKFVFSSYFCHVFFLTKLGIILNTKYKTKMYFVTSFKLSLRKLNCKKMEKLELIHLAPYFPYGLEVYDGTYIRKLVFTHSTYTLNEIGLSRLFNPNYDFSMGLPILRPLSDLTKEITHDGETFVPSESLSEWCHAFEAAMNKIIENPSDAQFMPYNFVNGLLEWHFDIYGLIDKNLAIDINTLK